MYVSKKRWRAEFNATRYLVEQSRFGGEVCEVLPGLLDELFLRVLTAHDGGRLASRLLNLHFRAALWLGLSDCCANILKREREEVYTKLLVRVANNLSSSKVCPPPSEGSGSPVCE